MVRGFDTIDPTPSPEVAIMRLSLDLGLGSIASLNAGGGVSLSALRQAALVAQGVPSDAASPPTITVSATTDAALTVNYPLASGGVLANTDKYTLIGGSPILWSSNTLTGLKSATMISGGNIGATAMQNASAVDTETASPTVEYRVFPQNGTRVRILTKVPGGEWEYAVAGGGTTTLQSSTSSTFVKVAYSGPLAGRCTRIELARTDGDIGMPAQVVTNIRLTTGYSAVSPTDTAPKVAFYGDSVAEGSKGGFHANGYTHLASWLLGWVPTQSAIGGSGFINSLANSNNYQNAARLDDLLLQDFSAVVVQASTNDLNQSQAAMTAAANIVLDGIRSRLPSKPIFVIGPWDNEAPAAMNAQRVLLRDGIEAATVGRAGVYWLDPTGLTFAQDGDGVHPTAAGMLTLATWLDTEVRGLIGL